MQHIRTRLVPRQRRIRQALQLTASLIQLRQRLAAPAPISVDAAFFRTTLVSYTQLVPPNGRGVATRESPHQVHTRPRPRAMQKQQLAQAQLSSRRWKRVRVSVVFDQSVECVWRVGRKSRRARQQARVYCPYVTHFPAQGGDAILGKRELNDGTAAQTLRN